MFPNILLKKHRIQNQNINLRVSKGKDYQFYELQ